MRLVLAVCVYLSLISTSNALEWVYMEEAPYVWSSSHDAWSQLYVSPDQELWVYHWGTGEWELVYKEATVVPTSLAFSILNLEVTSGAGGFFRLWFLGANDMKLGGLEATYGYDKSSGTNETTVVYHFIYGHSTAPHTGLSLLNLNWTSASGGTFILNTTTMTWLGEVFVDEGVGTFEWVKIP